ncbi:Clavaminate synthase-like protein, partial [Coniophora puteana RWD-64-598 SS2]
MPSLTLPQVPHYQPALPTHEDLPYADLAVIDLSKAHTLEGRTELAAELKNALLTHGFFYVVNHGFSHKQTERMFDIADVPIACVSDEEKLALEGNPRDTGVYSGYKLRQYWHLDAGVRDQQEHYNITRHVNDSRQPEVLVPYLPEVQALIEHMHFSILHPTLRIMALSLELPEETLVKLHDYDGPNGTWLRFQKYFPRTEDDEVKTKNVWMKGHTDIGTLSFLWSQPVAALQILTADEWHWVRYIENALIVNTGDALEFLTGGLYKATIHRVVQPPIDQRGYTRLGINYFCYANRDVKLAPLMESPVLRRTMLQLKCDPSVAPTMREWAVGRIMTYGGTKTELRQGKDE